MYLKEFLKHVDLYAAHNNSLNRVPLEQEKLVRLFIDALLDEDNSQAVFRGESKSFAYSKSGADHYVGMSSEEVLSFHSSTIFYIGSKAQSYLYENNNSDAPIDIKTIDNCAFKVIFEEIGYSIRRGWYQGSQAFNEYFLGNKEDDFLIKVNRVDDEEKQQIKIYYLWLLHVIGKTKYKRYSNFLSTTKDYEVAGDFSDGQIIYCGWIPRPIKKKSAYLGSLIQLAQRLTCLAACRT